MLKFFKKHQKGIIIGAAVGLIAAAYTISQGVDLSTISAAGSGLYDTLTNRTDTTAIAQTQLYISFALIGSTIGILCSMLWRRK